MKILGLHHNLLDIQGPTRLFLSMMDLFKGLGYDIHIVTRTPNKITKVEVTSPTLGTIEYKSSLMESRKFYKFKDIPKYHPLRHIRKPLADISLHEIPLMYPYYYFPEEVKKMALDADWIFTAYEYWLRLSEVIPEKTKRIIGYVHFPPEQSFPSDSDLNVWTNSEWTGHHIEKIWGELLLPDGKSYNWRGHYQVVYPPTNMDAYDPTKTFSERPYDIVMFSRLYEDKYTVLDELKGYRVAVIGASYGYKPPSWVDIYENVPFNTVKEILGKSKLYVHSKGYATKYTKSYPEHFGQTVVEAIASGCVPLVYADGGPVEIVPDPTFTWKNPIELCQEIDTLLEDKNVWELKQEWAIEKSRKLFSVEAVSKQVKTLLENED